MNDQSIRDRVRARALVQSGEARSIRQAAAATLAEVADEVGVTPTTVWRWEVGARCPRGDAAARYGAVLSRMHRQASKARTVKEVVG